MVMAQQYVYIGERTIVACLPKVQEDVQTMLDKCAPGCTLPPLLHANHGNYHAKGQYDSCPSCENDMCQIVHTLYHERM
jgi:hypothetical protein